MIAGLAIATGILSILDDQEDVNYDELLARAILLGNRDVFLEHLDEEQEKKFLEELRLSEIRQIGGHRWRVKARKLFVPTEEFTFMVANGCFECGSDIIDIKSDALTGNDERMKGAVCRACGHTAQKYQSLGRPK